MTQQLTKQTQQEVQQQAGKLLSQVAGYVGVRTMDIGLRLGILKEIAEHPNGIAADDLARNTSLDPLYVRVWCRSAYASELLEFGEGQSYKLAPHLDKLLLDHDHPGYVGGIPGIMVQPEFFEHFADRLPSGERLWWDDCSPEFIQSVGKTARPFYTRLVPGGLSMVPGLPDRLAQGAHILELACGAGHGLMRMADTYPKATFVAVDGDEYSLKLVDEKLGQNGLKARVSLLQSMLEDLSHSEEFDVAVINVSMHECRDIDKVTANVRDALKPGGYFVISDFPFPDSDEGCRTVPARVMCGIQFFEALIDDQLLPTQAFVDLLGKHEFRNVGSFDLTPVHAVTYGQK
jgi:SAM-dependent methyltransferase